MNHAQFLETVKDKKLVSSPKMMVHEMADLLYTFAKTSKRFTDIDYHLLKAEIEKMAQAKVRDIIEGNLDSKPDDPEDIQ